MSTLLHKGTKSCGCLSRHENRRKRTDGRIEVFGVMITFTELAQLSGWNYSTLRERIVFRGMNPVHAAFGIPRRGAPPTLPVGAGNKTA